MNNNKGRSQHKLSTSHGNLMDSRYLTSDETEASKVKVKRTKSFWKFGKNSSDSEILEGMALWRHRDLVDLDDTHKSPINNSQTRIRKPSRDESNDSDRTINNNQEAKSVVKPQKEVKKRDKQKKQQDVFDDDVYGPSYGDQFLDDEGDGLMLKTVNRRNILKQYSDDLEEDSDSASEMTISDDPYDCIVVDDQKVRKRDGQFPNVAELGKKLEKLSKSSKYSPDKHQENTTVKEKNEINVRRSKSRDRDTIEVQTVRESSFKTFKDNGERQNGERYYSESSKKGQKQQHKVDKDTDKQIRSSKKYYDSPNESDVGDSRQFLPRTKLSKTNSTSSKYDENHSLLDYGETLQRRMKNPEYNSKYDEKSAQNGNMYGPWYDLWGLDASTARK